MQSKIDDYRIILSNPRDDDKAIKIKEQCIYRLHNTTVQYYKKYLSFELPIFTRLAKLFTQAKQIAEVMNLLQSNSLFFNSIPKARTAKIVRTIINIVASTQSKDSLEIQGDWEIVLLKVFFA